MEYLRILISVYDDRILFCMATDELKVSNLRPPAPISRYRRILFYFFLNFREVKKMWPTVKNCSFLLLQDVETGELGSEMWSSNYEPYRAK